MLLDFKYDDNAKVVEIILGDEVHKSLVLDIIDLIGHKRLVNPKSIQRFRGVPLTVIQKENSLEDRKHQSAIRFKVIYQSKFNNE